MKKIDLEEQFETYLKKMDLTGNISRVQYVETKRAFMGACGQMLIIFRDEIGTIENEEEAVKQMKSLWDQVAEYWKKEAKLE